MLLLFLLALRFAWRLANPKPDDAELLPSSVQPRQIVHWGFYPLLFALMVSGYLISTADGRPIEVFDWFSVPSLVQKKGLEDTAGEVHEVARLGDDRPRRPARGRFPEAPLHRPQQHPEAHVVRPPFDLVIRFPFPTGDHPMKLTSSRPLLFAVIAAGLSAAAPAKAADYVIDTTKSHASINFRIKHLGFSWLTGRFDDFHRHVQL